MRSRRAQVMVCAAEPPRDGAYGRGRGRGQGTCAVRCAMAASRAMRTTSEGDRATRVLDVSRLWREKQLLTARAHS